MLVDCCPEEGVCRSYSNSSPDGSWNSRNVSLSNACPAKQKIVFRLQVAEQDIGKVIGRNGRTAQALRVLLAAVAAREGKRAILEIAN